MQPQYFKWMLLRMDVQKQSMKDLFAALLTVVRRRGFSHKKTRLPERLDVRDKYTKIRGYMHHYCDDTLTYSYHFFFHIYVFIFFGKKKRQWLTPHTHIHTKMKQKKRLLTFRASA